MGWFDPPAIALQKQLPTRLLSRFMTVREYAEYSLQSEKIQSQPYQLGVVLALWIKSGELDGGIALSRAESRKVQSIYESCMKVLRDDSLCAFLILASLSKQDATFGVPEEFFLQLAVNVS